MYNKLPDLGFSFGITEKCSAVLKKSLTFFYNGLTQITDELCANQQR